MQKEELIYRQREKELDELFDRTSWIFEEEESRAPRRKPEIYMPDGIDVLKTQSELDIEVDWRKNVTLKSFRPLIFFSVIWNLIIVFMVFQMLMAGALGAIIGVGLHAMVGFGMLHYILSMIFSRTILTVRAGTIEVRHEGLFSWHRKNHHLDVKSLKQFYVRRERSGSVNGVPTFAYSLYVIKKSGEKIRLIRGLNHDSLLYVEQEIERYIGMEDLSISGEARVSTKAKKSS